MNRELKQKTVSGIKWIGLSTFTTFVILFVQMGILARYIEKSDFGILAILFIVLNTYYALVDLGFGNLIIYKQELSSKAKSSIFWLTCLIGFVSAWVSYILPNFISSSVVDLNPNLWIGLKYLSALFLFHGIGVIFELNFRKNLNFKPVALAEMSGTIIGFIMMLYMISKGRGLFSILTALVIASLIKSIGLVFAHRKVWLPGFVFSIEELRNNSGYAFFQLGDKLLNVFQFSTDKIVAWFQLNLVSLGVYSVAYNMMQRPVSLVNMILTRVGFPLFSAIQKDSQKIRRVYMDSLKMVSFYIFPLCTILFVLAYEFFEVWLGKGWGKSAELFQILIWLALYFGLSNPINNLILGKGWVKLSFGLNVFGLCLNTIAVIIGSQYGTIGLAWSVVLSMGGVMFLIDLVLIYKFEKISPWEIVQNIYPFILCSLLMGVMLTIVKSYISSMDTLFQLIVLIILSMVIYLTLMFLFQKEYLLNTFNTLLNKKEKSD